MTQNPPSKPFITMLLGSVILNILALMILGIVAFLMNSPSIHLGYARGRVIGEMMGYLSLGVFLSCVAAAYFWQQNPAENKRQAMIAIGAGAIYLLVVGTVVIRMFVMNS